MEPNKYSIFSCNGFGGGKLAFLLGVNVNFVYGGDQKHAWTRTVSDRKITLPRPINLGISKKEKLPKNCLNYDVSRSISKKHTFEVFKKLGIPHPAPINTEEFKETWNGKETKILGRKDGRSHGEGISLIHLKDGDPCPKFTNYDFYVPFIEVSQEFRFYVFHGEIFFEINKQLAKNGFIHSVKLGAKFVPGIVKHPKKELITKQAIAATNELGLDFAAFDVISDKNGNYYFLESGSDPTLSNEIAYSFSSTLRRYFNMPQDDRWYFNSEGKVVLRDDLKKAIKFTFKK